MVTKLETSPVHLAKMATHRQTVQLAVPHDAEGLKSYFEKDAAGNIVIKNEQMKELLNKQALSASKRGEAQSLTINIGVDF